RQRRADGTPTLDGVRRVLYRLPDVIQAVAEERRVFVVEGEKDVESLGDVGVVATTVAGGASAPLPDDIADVFDGATVVIIPDNDKAGHAFADRVARAILGRASSVKLLSLPGVPAKEDVTWWIEHGGTVTALNELASQAFEFSPTESGRPIAIDQAPFVVN